MPVVVKVCGLTRREDVRWAVECGADMVGFVFAGGPRQILLAEAKTLAGGLPESVEKVGVFVNPSLSELEEAIDFCGLDRVQLHGEVSPGLSPSLAGKAIVAIRLAKDANAGDILAQMAKLAEGGISLFLVDSAVPGQWGGTGVLADWSLAGGLARRFPLILAGGLTPENVAEAIAKVRPWGVDVSSGVEASPGIKDGAKVARFIAAAKGAKDASA